MSIDKPFGMAEIKQEGKSAQYDPGATPGQSASKIKPPTAEELIQYLKECADDHNYFEIDSGHARILWEHIEQLRMAAEDDRGIL